MKTTNNIITSDSKTNLSLRQLIGDVIQKSSPGQGQNKVIIKTHVPADLYINANESIIATVIETMLHAMKTNATDGDIDIVAKEVFENTIKVSVRDTNCYNTYAVACSLQNAVPLAEQIGGYLNITNQRQKITTIEFSFPFPKEEDRSRYDD